MAKVCQTCKGSKYIKRPLKRTWWEVLLKRPDSVNEVCGTCNGDGKIKGSVEEEHKEFKDLCYNFAKGKVQGFDLSAAAASLGASAIPELTRLLKEDGELGRTAVIALSNMPPDLALPLVEFALGKARKAAIRYYAAEYLKNHPTEEAKELARRHLSSEKDADTRRLLEASLK